MERRVCMVEALYPLMFYLLISSAEEIQSTYFVLDERIDPNICNRLPNVCNEKRGALYKHRYCLLLYGKLLQYTKYSFLRKSNVFGLDFKWYLLQGLRINYIEDCPNVFNLWETSPMYGNYIKNLQRPKWKQKIEKLIFGSFYRHPVATSDGIKAIYTTAACQKSYLEGKKQFVFDLKNEWEESSDEKKKLILSIFDISDNDLEELKTKKVMLLTQAFYDDKMVTVEEQIEIYRKILDNYNHDDVIIKAHPRDRLDYRKCFPDVMYFDKVVPLQFLSIIGVKFSHVATVSSSSALSFGDDVQIDWYGGGVHPGILKAEGIRTLEKALREYKEQHKC